MDLVVAHDLGERFIMPSSIAVDLKRGAMSQTGRLSRPRFARITTEDAVS
jgi:hypothetical protein